MAKMTKTENKAVLTVLDKMLNKLPRYQGKFKKDPLNRVSKKGLTAVMLESNEEEANAQLATIAPENQILWLSQVEIKHLEDTLKNESPFIMVDYIAEDGPRKGERIAYLRLEDEFFSRMRELELSSTDLAGSKTSVYDDAFAPFLAVKLQNSVSKQSFANGLASKLPNNTPTATPEPEATIQYK